MHIGFVLGIIVLFMGSALAFAVSSPGSVITSSNGNKELYMLPGETSNVEYLLQNGGGATILADVRVDIIEGADIIEITDPDNLYAVEPGDRVAVNMFVTAPTNAQIGDTYGVSISFYTGSGGSFFGAAIQNKFDLVIGERPAEVEEPEPLQQEEAPTISGNTTLIISIIVIFLIILIVIFWVIKSRKRKMNQGDIAPKKAPSLKP